MKKVDLSKFKNDWYRPGSKLKIFIWLLTSRLVFENKLFTSITLKRYILKVFGCKTGKNVVIKPMVKIKYPWNLELGDNTWVGEEVWIDNLDKVKIGRNVCISQGAYILCGNHDFKSTTFDLIVKPINIEDGAWIGAKSIVCPGVTVKSHAILSVGSVTSKNLEPYTIYKGNPAVSQKNRDL